MKYAARYYRRLDTTNWDEIIIKFPEPKIEICEFIQKYSEQQRVILVINGWDIETFEKSLLILRKAKEAHPNLAVMINPVQHKHIADALNSEKIPYFFDKPAQSISVLWSFIKADVAEVYIGGDLGFSMQSIADICHARNIKIRVVPNVSQRTSYLPNDLPPFFIRPEDLRLYEKYVDTIEFQGGLDKQNVLKKIYKDDQAWPDYLRYIILDLEEDEDVWNECLIPSFGKHRLNCNKKCGLLKCNHCRMIAGIAKKLEVQDLVFKEKKAELMREPAQENEKIEL